jgi:hypothetical protein
MQTDMFDRFAVQIKNLTPGVSTDPSMAIATEEPYALYYAPFEYINPSAKLVLVGITPGPTQLKLAYETARDLLVQGLPKQELLAKVKKAAGFGGQMRRRLQKMLDYFRIPELLGIEYSASLWAEHWYLTQLTSIIPYAAFKRGKPFNGKFDEVVSHRLLFECFRDCFISELKNLPSNALYLAVGRTPLDGLNWCIKEGVIGSLQVIGRLAHPSPQSGSAVPYFIEEVSREKMDPKDPVLHRCDDLDLARSQIKNSVQTLIRSGFVSNAARPKEG